MITYERRIEQCPTCGSMTKVSKSSEGTCCYEPSLPVLCHLDISPVEQGWYWCCEGYSPYAQYVVFVSNNSGHSYHEMSYDEAADIDAQWWGPISAPEDPKFYGKLQIQR